MKARSNVRCYLPKSEAAKLVTVFQQLHAIAETPPECRELADKDRPA